MSDDSKQKLLDRLNISYLHSQHCSCIHLILSFRECDGLKRLNYELQQKGLFFTAKPFATVSLFPFTLHYSRSSLNAI